MRKITFEGTNVQDGDRAKWVVHDATSCDSKFDVTRAAGTSGGAVNFFFKDDPHRHICEVQLVHKQLMLIRQEMGGHHE